MQVNTSSRATSIAIEELDDRIAVTFRACR